MSATTLQLTNLNFDFSESDLLQKLQHFDVKTIDQFKLDGETKKLDAFISLPSPQIALEVLQYLKVSFLFLSFLFFSFFSDGFLWK